MSRASAVSHSGPLPPLGNPAGVAPKLIRWYRRCRRDLPWRRRSSDAYAQLISELMLQQTQVATVIGYYERFMARFPAVEDLAAGELDEVLRLWAGLGYYRRARLLHAAAKKIVDEHAGRLPSDVASLMRLPGIGRYTAGAIASIAYGTRAAVLDGNVARVLMRLAAWDADAKAPQVREQLWALAESLLPARNCGDFNQGLMELGATVCRPVSPECDKCPLRGGCAARAGGLADTIPRPARRVRMGHAEFVVAAVRGDGRLLFVQRPAKGLWAGLWELPCVELLPAESLTDARKRLRTTLPAGCRLSSSPATVVTRQLTHRRVTFRVFRASNPTCGGENATTRWLSPEEYGTVGISRATCAILESLDAAGTLP